MKIKLKYLIVFLLIFLTIILNAEENTKNDRGMVFLPLIGYTPETSLAMAVALSAYNNPDPLNPDQKYDTAMAAITYTLNEQGGISFSGNKFFNSNSNLLSGSIGFSKAPSSFYGIGNNVTDETEEEYNHTLLEVKSSFMTEVRDNLYIGPELVFYSDTLEEKEKMLAAGAVEGSEGITQLGAGVVITVDTTDSFSYPHSGILYKINWNIFNQKAGSEYSYNHFLIDLRNYFHIAGEHVIGINAVYDITEGDVPFQMLPQLGGANIMRGFLQEKYKDKHYAALQSEYRFPIAGPFGGVVFAGAGNIAPGINKFDFNELKTSAGCGMRFNLNKKQRMNLRFDLAFNSDNETQFYMSLMEAF